MENYYDYQKFLEKREFVNKFNSRRTDNPFHIDISMNAGSGDKGYVTISISKRAINCGVSDLSQLKKICELFETQFEVSNEKIVIQEGTHNNMCEHGSARFTVTIPCKI